MTPRDVSAMLCRPRFAAGAGEIWWADVPYRNHTGSKFRPCLVIGASGGILHVLKITSQARRRRDCIELPNTRGWDPWARHNSFVDLSQALHVPYAAFSRRAGRADAATWRRVAARYGRIDDYAA
jgi:hypothetical protein